MGVVGEEEGMGEEGGRGGRDLTLTPVGKRKVTVKR